MDCSICLENFDNQTMVICITETHKHGFCQTCYDDWCNTCNQNNNDVMCPICHICLIPNESQMIISNNNNDFNNINDNLAESNKVDDEINNNINHTYENNIFTEYYDAEKTQKKFEVTKTNNKFEGIGITYWINGNIMRISNYMNHTKYGIQKEYTQNGTLYGIEYVYEGELHGFRKVFNKDETVNRIESYICGNLINNNFLEEIRNRN